MCGRELLASVTSTFECGLSSVAGCAIASLIWGEGWVFGEFDELSAMRTQTVANLWGAQIKCASGSTPADRFLRVSA